MNKMNTGFVYIPLFIPNGRDEFPSRKHSGETKGKPLFPI
jgi:hypothetical protein